MEDVGQPASVRGRALHCRGAGSRSDSSGSQAGAKLSEVVTPPPSPSTGAPASDLQEEVRMSCMWRGSRWGGRGRISLRRSYAKRNSEID